MTRRSETTQKKGAKQSSTGKTAAKPTIVNPCGPAAKAEPAKMHDVKSGSPVANKNDKDDPLSNKNRLTAALKKYSPDSKASRSPHEPSRSVYAHRVITCGTPSGHAFAKICDRTSHDKPGWDMEFYKEMVANHESSSKLKIHMIKSHRSLSGNPAEKCELMITTRQGNEFRKDWHAYIRIVNPEKNTPKLRAKWGECLAAVLTMRGAPKKLITGVVSKPNQCIYVGDLTPSDDYLYVGDLLTIDETVECAIESIPSIETNEAFLQDDDLVALYFGPRRVKEVCDYYKRCGMTKRDHAEDDGGDQESTHDPLSSLDLSAINSDTDD